MSISENFSWKSIFFKTKKNILRRLLWQKKFFVKVTKMTSSKISFTQNILKFPKNCVFWCNTVKVVKFSSVYCSSTFISVLQRKKFSKISAKMFFYAMNIFMHRHNVTLIFQRNKSNFFKKILLLLFFTFFREFF